MGLKTMVKKAKRNWRLQYLEMTDKEIKARNRKKMSDLRKLKKKK